MLSEIDPKGIVREDEMREGMYKTSHGPRSLGRLAGGVRDKLTMSEMKARMATLWKDGEFYSSIADKVSDEFGLTGEARLKANSISYHIKEMLRYWREVGLLSVDEKQAMALARWEQLEAMATEALFISMQGKSTKNYEKTIDRARSRDRAEWIREEIAHERVQATLRGVPIETHGTGGIEDVLEVTAEKIKEYERHEESSAGDPRWLALLIDIHDKRCKMWNLYSKPTDGRNPDQELARLPDDVRDSRIASVVTAAIMRKTGEKGLLAPSAPLGGHPITQVDDEEFIAEGGAE